MDGNIFIRLDFFFHSKTQMNLLFSTLLIRFYWTVDIIFLAPPTFDHIRLNVELSYVMTLAPPGGGDGISRWFRTALIHGSERLQTDETPTPSAPGVGGRVVGRRQSGGVTWFIGLRLLQDPSVCCHGVYLCLRSHSWTFRVHADQNQDRNDTEHQR